MRTVNLHSTAQNYKWLAVIGLISLTACAAHVSIREPFNVSKANEIFKTQFEVKHPGTYSFGLMFTWTKSREENDKRSEIFGDINKSGIPIKVHLRVQRGNEIIFNKFVTTSGTSFYQTFSYENRMISTAVRVIRYLDLPAGIYSVDLRTISNTEPFTDIESYAEISYHNPKH